MLDLREMANSPEDVRAVARTNMCTACAVILVPGCSCSIMWHVFVLISEAIVYLRRPSLWCSAVFYFAVSSESHCNR